MAEGRAVGDVYSTKALKAALPQKEEDEEKQLKVISLEIKVVSWNINGPGKAEPRNLLVPAVVQKENPDVLLLQEVPSDKIISLCNNNSRTYCSVTAGKSSEARILYDPILFEVLEPKRAVDLHVAEVFAIEGRAREMRGGQKLGEEELFRDRVAVVRLRHRPTGKGIVFLSFHNIRTSGDVKGTATGFCEIVRRIAEHEKLPVVAGADLNCKGFRRGKTRVPEYELLTNRRRSKVDFFLHSSPFPGVVSFEGSVSALHVFPEDGEMTHPYQTVMRDLRRRHPEHLVAHYSSSLDHDPLYDRLRVKWIESAQKR